MLRFLKIYIIFVLNSCNHNLFLLTNAYKFRPFSKWQNYSKTNQNGMLCNVSARSSVCHIKLVVGTPNSKTKISCGMIIHKNIFSLKSAEK